MILEPPYDRRFVDLDFMHPHSHAVIDLNCLAKIRRCSFQLYIFVLDYRVETTIDLMILVAWLLQMGDSLVARNQDMSFIAPSRPLVCSSKNNWEFVVDFLTAMLLNYVAYYALFGGWQYFRKLSHPEKLILANAFTKLSADNIVKALKIVKESNPNFKDSIDMVTLDLDSQVCHIIYINTDVCFHSFSNFVCLILSIKFWFCLASVISYLLISLAYYSTERLHIV